MTKIARPFIGRQSWSKMAKLKIDIETRENRRLTWPEFTDDWLDFEIKPEKTEPTKWRKNDTSFRW